MKRKLFAHLRKWHRILGISASIFILLLSLSGIVLNHSDQFTLPTTHVKSEFILSFYGLSDPEKIRAFEINHSTLIATDDQLWLGDKLVLDNVGSLVSAVYFNGVIVAIVDEQLLLLSSEGEVIEKMDTTAGIPKNISHLATQLNGKLNADKIWLKTTTAWYVSDEQLLHWQLAETSLIPDWVKPVELSEVQLDQAHKNFRSRVINWERVLLDFHSGRIFGIAGPLFSDLVALLLILLSISGIAMWLRNARKKKTNR
jgi:hypothetical protein